MLLIFDDAAGTDGAGDTDSTVDDADWSAKYIPLHRAILRDDWDTVHEIISKDKEAITSEIDTNGTPLHVAVVLHKNIKLFENLLNMIDPESLPSILSRLKRNTLHRAAAVGNTEAAKMLVHKNPHLLFISDSLKELPIHRAVSLVQQTTYHYLLDVCKQHIHLSNQDGYDSPFEGLQGAKLLINVINKGYFGKFGF
ncbi:uncharacterized protein [Rutidosis leptorrhynchoides]|uniref:uncharacterized protein n=1 Tax=Rutidosis leptorrhynchoides TaxID=125765 RepID=UPI003A9A64DB